MIFYLGKHSALLDYLCGWCCKNRKPLGILDAEQVRPREYYEAFKGEFLISYGYKKIIEREVIEYFSHRIINCHVSYLPWNRGMHPNVWSWVDNTPKGVTIHELTEGLDKGPILAQKEVPLNEEDTLEETYNQLSDAMANLFKEKWPQIYDGKISPKDQEGKGTYHSSRDLSKVYRPRYWKTKCKDVRLKI